jgi:hypothetical protein
MNWQPDSEIGRPSECKPKPIIRLVRPSQAQAQSVRPHGSESDSVR